MENRKWTDAVVGGVVVIALAPIPGSAIVGSGLSGYLSGTAVIDGLRTGALAGIFAVLFFWFSSISLEILQGEISNWWLLVRPLIVQSFSTLLLSILGGAIGAYTRREISMS